jgi:hypothetical protein
MKLSVQLLNLKPKSGKPSSYNLESGNTYRIVDFDKDQALMTAILEICNIFERNFGVKIEGSDTSDQEFVILASVEGRDVESFSKDLRDVFFLLTALEQAMEIHHGGAALPRDLN